MLFSDLMAPRDAGQADDFLLNDKKSGSGLALEWSD